MSVKDINLVLDIQDGTNGNNLAIIDYDEFLHSNKQYDLTINTDLTLGEFKLFNEIGKALREKQHDIFIKIGYKS